MQEKGRQKASQATPRPAASAKEAAEKWFEREPKEHVAYVASLGGSRLTTVFPEMVQEVKLTEASLVMYKPPPCKDAWEKAREVRGRGGAETCDYM